jgi:hypothetical protein
METLEHYYELTGTAAVTLIGLLFVVMTLGADRQQDGDRALLRVFLTPTLVHLGVVFFIALLALSPERDSLILPFGLVGVIGLAYSLVIMRKAERADRTFDAWFYHGAIPIVCYAGVVAAAWPGGLSSRQADLVLRAVSALFLLVGMRNAWAVAIDIARRRHR